MKSVLKSASNKDLKDWEATIKAPGVKAEIQREIKRRKRRHENKKTITLS